MKLIESQSLLFSVDIHQCFLIAHFPSGDLLNLLSPWTRFEVPDIVETLDRAVREISCPDVVATIRSHLVVPRVVMRDWDYKDDTQYPCWIIAVHPESRTALAYCEFGFGPIAPWGLLKEPSEFNGMGMDCCWFSRLEDAVRQSMMWGGESPSGYEVQ